MKRRSIFLDVCITFMTAGMDGFAGGAATTDAVGETKIDTSPTVEYRLYCQMLSAP